MLLPSVVTAVIHGSLTNTCGPLQSQRSYADCDYTVFLKGIVNPPQLKDNSVNLFTLMSNLNDLIYSMEDINIFLTLYNMVSFHLAKLVNINC